MVTIILFSLSLVGLGAGIAYASANNEGVFHLAIQKEDEGDKYHVSFETNVFFFGGIVLAIGSSVAGLLQI